MATDTFLTFNGSRFAGYQISYDSTVAGVLKVAMVDGDGNPLGGSGASANQIQGNVASGATDSGNPVKTGGRASSSVPSAASDGQRVNAWFSQNGAQVVSIGQAGSPVDGVGNGAALCQNSSNGLQYHLGTMSWVYNGSSWDRQRGDVTASWVKPPPLAKSASAVTAGSTSSQQLFAANAIRSKLIIQNQDAAINVFINLGAAAVAGAGNLRIAPGSTLELAGVSQAVNLIAASGTPAVCAWEF